MEKTNSNDTYARFNCQRITMYLNDGIRKNGNFFTEWIRSTSEFAFQCVLALFLIILVNLWFTYRPTYFQEGVLNNVIGIALSKGAIISTRIGTSRYNFNQSILFTIFYYYFNFFYNI